jgi:hypothetical protein
MPAGRPTRYRADYAEQARQAYALGACDEDIARFFSVDISTVYRWRHQHAEFAAASVIGKAAADDRVEQALYQRAIGYDYTAERAFMPAHAPDPVIARYRKRVLADPRTALQWLRVRRREAWRGAEEEGKNALADILEEAFRRVAEGRADDGQG